MKVLAVGDLHKPWCLWPLLNRIAKRAHEWKPDYLVQVGDMVDGKAWARFDKDTDAPNADLEFSMVERSFERLDRLLPKSLPKIILVGNHDLRHLTKATQAQIPSQLIKSLPEALHLPGWTWHTKRAPLILDGVAYIHGDEVDGSGIAVHRQTGYPTVHGHLHVKASICYDSTWDRDVWTMNVGTAWDRESVAARYGSRRVTKSWIGWGEVENRLPALKPWSLMKNR